MFGKDRICAVVASQDAGGTLRQFRKALRSTGTVELRLDWLKSRTELQHFLATLRRKRPRATLIATLRRRVAGGQYRGQVANQLAALKSAFRAGCRWCDLEGESVARTGRKIFSEFVPSARRIVSVHFWGRTPKRLDRILGGLEATGSDAVKIAAYCRTIADSLRVLALARRRRNLIAVPMGEIATAARILALREGSALAYAPVENATAPGQVSLEEIKKLYRADRLNRRTRIYGVIGDPVSHSLSPRMQNAGFQAQGINAVYLPFLVRELRDFLAAIQPLGIAGFSVTLPHKERILHYLDDCDPLAASIGAVNTVVVRSRGKLFGYNTDYVGVLRALERKMPIAGSRVLIFGAGGAARAVGFALARAGATVCVSARRMNRATALAQAVQGQAIPKVQLRREFFDAIVNATPVGMRPLAAHSPLALEELNCRLVFDVVYRPRHTRLLQLAARRGIETVSGVEMFIAQGAAQWEIWMGERAPVALMRRAVLEALRREEKAGAAPRRK